MAWLRELLAGRYDRSYVAYQAEYMPRLQRTPLHLAGPAMISYVHRGKVGAVTHP